MHGAVAERGEEGGGVLAGRAGGRIPVDGKDTFGLIFGLDSS